MLFYQAKIEAEAEAEAEDILSIAVIELNSSSSENGDESDNELAKTDAVVHSSDTDGANA